MLNISLRELLEAGCHFGHQVSRWNPKAGEFIYQARDGIHIIDLAKTKKGLEEAYEFLKNKVAEGKVVIFVGTKRQGKVILKEEAERCGVFYISERWVGGLLTNWEEVKKNLDKIRKLEENIKNEEGVYKKAEVGKFQLKLERLLKFYGGIRELKRPPEVLFVLDIKKEDNSVREARKIGVATIGIVDTNSDPAMVDFPVPANDDAVGSIKKLVSIMADAVLEGKSIVEKNAAKQIKQQEKSDAKEAKKAGVIEQKKKEEVVKAEVKEVKAKPSVKAVKKAKTAE